ncbi:T9SS type A sorting domain-containing protein [Sediminitomix flava]|uniref:Putative secreted protein (Por secretion system target) n=1 Tax=Sediminitomix flava TaxID=379075 RepID=A0A315ZFG0_SEDFL|nr:T9SS type A sorting domain-containing protein [Sediminitomix flava]PWJ43890.1 putative secreted protein (Por secretion system target) [Sediminitomix flava]
MKKSLLLGLVCFLIGFTSSAQDWANISIPANAGNGNVWQLQSNVSDDFNYTFNASNSKTNFGPNNMWYNFYHNQWDGPGTTYWKYNHVSVKNGNLVLKASRFNKSNQPNPQYPYPGATESYKMGKTNGGVNSGCITSNNKVSYPVYVETSLSVANIALASCFWLLSPDDTQEIDIIENYGDVNFFKQFTHISHHSFIRKPFHDYQPRDWNSWWPDGRVSSNYGWGDWCWNNGNRRFFRLGVYWISPNHFEYYIDGNLVRVLYNNAIATNMNGTWEYTYYNAIHPAGTQDQYGTNIGGTPTNTNGYSDVTTYATGSNYSFSTLQAASNASNGINVIDPGNYQNGTGFNKAMDIIVNVESQSWLVSSGQTPSDADLNSLSKNEMKVDWIRAYKPVPNNGGGNSEVVIEAENFNATGGTFNDGTVPYGANIAGSIINFVNGGDWMEYLVNIPQEGAYEVTYRYATPNSNTSVNFDVSGVYSFNTTLQNTGSWGNYSNATASSTAYFTAGNHLIKLTAGTAAWQWNLDKVTLTKTGASRKAETQTIELQSPRILVSPNPSEDFINISGLSNGEYVLTLADLNGKAVLSQNINFNTTFRLDVSNMTNGMYILNIRGLNTNSNTKLLIQ